jgi:hypothetical protein
MLLSNQQRRSQRLRQRGFAAPFPRRRGRFAFWGKEIMASKEAIEAALKEFEDKLTKKEVTISTAEYMKLLQLSQELAEDEPKEIKVEWVEAPKSTEA